MDVSPSIPVQWSSIIGRMYDFQFHCLTGVQPLIRERALKVALVLVGLLFVALVYPYDVVRREPKLVKMLSVFLQESPFVLAVRQKYTTTLQTRSAGCPLCDVSKQ